MPPLQDCEARKGCVYGSGGRPAITIHSTDTDCWNRPFNLAQLLPVLARTSQLLSTLYISRDEKTNEQTDTVGSLPPSTR